MLRVIQSSSGNVARRALRTIAEHPEQELVGPCAHGADEGGCDADELCGHPPPGVRATNDLD